MTGKTSYISALISAGVTALLGLLTAFGLELNTVQLAAILSATGFISIVVTVVLWAKTVPKAKVLEVLIGDEVVAGPANDMAVEGEIIRQVEPRRASGS